MEIVNNFDQISAMLKPSPGMFYVIEVIARRKENADQKTHSKMIKTYDVVDQKELDDCRESIIKACLDNNARAYIRLNRRSRETVALQMLRELAGRIADKNYDIRNLYQSVLGKYNSDPDKTWILDLDDSEDFVWTDESIERLKVAIDEIRRHRNLRDSEFHLIPTLNGNHLITRPFDISLLVKTSNRKFQLFSDIDDLIGRFDIHKDNPTILFACRKEIIIIKGTF